jgi:hypothetical protein
LRPEKASLLRVLAKFLGGCDGAQRLLSLLAKQFRTVHRGLGPARIAN